MHPLPFPRLYSEAVIPGHCLYKYFSPETGYGYFTVALGSFLEGETVLLAGSQEPIDTQAALNLRRVFSIPRRYEFEKLVSMVLRAIQGLSGCIALSCTALQIIAGAKRLA